jgi:hypothetical protein
MFCRSLFVSLSLFLLAIALSVLLRFATFDYGLLIYRDCIGRYDGGPCLESTIFPPH